jgi:hypothetical protein
MPDALFCLMPVPYACVAQWIEHLTSDQRVGGSNPSARAYKTGVRRQAKPGDRPTRQASGDRQNQATGLRDRRQATGKTRRLQQQSEGCGHARVRVWPAPARDDGQGDWSEALHRPVGLAEGSEAVRSDSKGRRGLSQRGRWPARRAAARGGCWLDRREHRGRLRQARRQRLHQLPENRQRVGPRSSRLVSEDPRSPVAWRIGSHLASSHSHRTREDVKLYDWQARPARWYLVPRLILTPSLA